MEKYKIEVVKTLSNNYIVIKGNCCVIFDCGGKAVTNKLKELNVRPLALFVTHLHFDHVTGVKHLVNNFDVKVYLPAYKRSEIFDVNVAIGKVALKGVDYIPIESDEVIRIDEFEVKAIRTGGHLKHHTCYAIDDGGILVLGDVGVVKNGNVVTRVDKVRTIIERGKYRVFLPGHGNYIL